MFEFWLLNETTQAVLLLPVTPAGYEMSYGKEIETVRVTNIGDVNVLGRRKPKGITLQSFFTTKQYPFARYTGVTVNHAADYVKLLAGWAEGEDIIRVIIADDDGPRVNERFYIEDFTAGEQFGDNGDIQFTISFRQKTPLQAVTIQQTAGENKKRADAATAVSVKKAKSYTVKSGDCLSAIAREVYGDASQWRKIYEANRSIIGKNPNLIFPGQTYTIP